MEFDPDCTFFDIFHINERVHVIVKGKDLDLGSLGQSMKTINFDWKAEQIMCVSLLPKWKNSLASVGKLR